VRLGQTSHLLTPFVGDAEGRSHDGSHAKAALIEINRKKRRTDCLSHRFRCNSPIPTGFHYSAHCCDVPRRTAAKAGERATLSMPGPETINPIESGCSVLPPPFPQAQERFVTCYPRAKSGCPGFDVSGPVWKHGGALPNQPDTLPEPLTHLGFGSSFRNHVVVCPSGAPKGQPHKSPARPLRPPPWDAPPRHRFIWGP
jgi:hypothetical protein